MEFFALLTALLVVVELHALPVYGVLSSATCATQLVGGLESGWLSKRATTCRLDALKACQEQSLTGSVFLSGAVNKTIWDLSTGGDGALTFAQGANVTVSCLSVLLDSSSPSEAQLLPLSINTLLAPPFLSAAEGRVSALTMRDVEYKLDCSQLLDWEALLCSVRLPGLAKIEGPEIVIISWRAENVYLEGVTLTCDPGTAAFVPACSMTAVDAVEAIHAATRALQAPTMPLVLILSRSLNFTDANWPETGVRITGNVTLSAPLDSTLAISFGLKTVLFTVDSKSSSAAFLSFRGLVLKDLPLSYLPLNHPRRPFGILSTGLWPVYREEVAMGLYNCTLILTNEEFLFWSFWLSILISPIPNVRALGNWSYATGVQLEPSGDDYIQLSSYYGRYTTLVDVRYQVSNEVYATQQRNNILQITGNAQVPPTVVFQIRDVDDLFRALSEDGAPSAAQHGLYIILTENITLAHVTDWPAGGMPVQYPTTVTTWPSALVAFDVQLEQNIFSLSGTVLLKNLVVVNLGASSAEGSYGLLTSGLWAFNFSNWRSADQQRIAVESTVMVVSRAEVDYYLDVAVERNLGGDTWITSYQVDSYDTGNRSWVSFTTIATLRFTGQKVNISCEMPHMFDSLPVDDQGSGGFLSNPGHSGSKDTDRRDILLFSLLGIALPSVVVAVVVTYVVLRRRRLRQMCSKAYSGGDLSGGAEAKAGSRRRSNVDPKDEGIAQEDGADLQENAGPANGQEILCCFGLPVPLRKSKFVNPLYDEGGSLPTEVVLTGLLGPSGRGCPRGPAPLPVPVLLGAEATLEDASVSSEDEVEEPKQPAAPEMEAAGASARSGSGAAAGDRSRGGALWRPRDERDGGMPPSAPQCPEIVAESSGQTALPRVSTQHHNDSSEAGGPRLLAAPGTSMSCAAAAAAESYGGARAETVVARQGGDGGTGSRAASSRSVSVSQRLQRQSSSDADEAAEDAGAAAAARQQSGSEAGPAVPMPDMQRLERLRRDIADQHLEVQHSLGWGGGGVVYKGTWKGLNVAVKTVLVQGDTRQSRQLLTEAAISASLQHANVVTTYMYELRPLDEVDPQTGGADLRLHLRSLDGSHNGVAAGRMACWKLYIVQEFCDLGTLKAAIDQGNFKGTRSGLPNMAFLLSIALDMANGLTHVHSKDVVHGDVTVSNVLMQTCPTRAQGCVAKVADFGLSVKLDAGQSHSSQLYGGTPHYMAPERASGVLSKASDIYSLGVCLWEIYCGTPSWRRNSVGGRNRHYTGSNNSMDSMGNDSYGMAVAANGSDVFAFPRNCPSEYSSLVLSCLALDMHRRPTAPGVVAALQRLQRRYG